MAEPADTLHHDERLRLEAFAQANAMVGMPADGAPTRTDAVITEAVKIEAWLRDGTTPPAPETPGATVRALRGDS